MPTNCKMPVKRKERENSNESSSVKSCRMDHIPTEHELFLQAFESKCLFYCTIIRNQWIPFKIYETYDDNDDTL